MKILSRDFTRGEKVLIALLLIALIALGYYQFVDKPVRESIVAADQERSMLETELTAVNAKVADLNRMQNELDSMQGSVSLMPSYNNSKAELDLLNDILADTEQYSISMSNVTRSGDQIRRGFALQFTVADYDTMKATISRLSSSEFRCLIDDIRVAYSEQGVSVSATATFYETMVGGVVDAGLPNDSSAE